jgi:hypothetical protein
MMAEWAERYKQHEMQKYRPGMTRLKRKEMRSSRKAMILQGDTQSLN